MIPSVFVAGILTFLWPHMYGTGPLVAVALLYGASAGAFTSLIGSPMIALGDSTDVGRRTGMYLTVLSIGSLMGPPISGAINHATDGYSVVGIYAGQSPFTFSPVGPSEPRMESVLTVYPWLCFVFVYRLPSP